MSLILCCLLCFVTVFAQAPAEEPAPLTPELQELATALVESEGEEWIVVRHKALDLADERFSLLVEFLDRGDAPSQKVATLLRIRREEPARSSEFDQIAQDILRLSIPAHGQPLWHEVYGERLAEERETFGFLAQELSWKRVDLPKEYRLYLAYLRPFAELEFLLYLHERDPASVTTGFLAFDDPRALEAFMESYKYLRSQAPPRYARDPYPAAQAAWMLARSDRTDILDALRAIVAHEQNLAAAAGRELLDLESANAVARHLEQEALALNSESSAAVTLEQRDAVESKREDLRRRLVQSFRDREIAQSLHHVKRRIALLERESPTLITND